MRLRSIRSANCWQRKKAPASLSPSSKTGPGSPASTPSRSSSFLIANASPAAKAIRASCCDRAIGRRLRRPAPCKMHYQAEDKANEKHPEQNFRDDSEGGCGLGQPEDRHDDGGHKKGDCPTQHNSNPHARWTRTGPGCDNPEVSLGDFCMVP